MLYGSGEFTYELIIGWAKLRPDWKWGASSGIAADAQDNVYLFNRSDHPVMVFDRDGNPLDSWGEDVGFGRPHGAFITPDQCLYCCDDQRHVIRKFTLKGELLEMLGTPDQCSDTGYVHEGTLMQRLDSIKRGAGPFNRPTKLVIAPWGEKYVSDGYGNARVHRFTADNELIGSWGEPGHGPGEFFLPHSVLIDDRDRVILCDRENNRIQLFSRSGEFLEKWEGIRRPGDIALREGRLYVAHSPSSVSILDLDGHTLASFAVDKEVMGGSHSICVDSRGDIYVGEIWRETETLHKFVWVG